MALVTITGFLVIHATPQRCTIAEGKKTSVETQASFRNGKLTSNPGTLYRCIDELILCMYKLLGDSQYTFFVIYRNFNIRYEPLNWISYSDQQHIFFFLNKLILHIIGFMYYWKSFSYSSTILLVDCLFAVKLRDNQ